MTFLDRQLMNRAIGILLPFIALALLSGCRSGLGLFLPVDAHPRLMAEAREALIQTNDRRLDSLLADLEDRTASSSRLLYLLESARLKSLAAQTPNSIELFSEADGLLNDNMLRASFTVTESAQTALSLVTNDRALPYRGHLFERLFLNYFQAMNHLETGEPALARIELNKAQRDMRWGKDNLPQLRREADQALGRNGIEASSRPPGFGQYPAGLSMDSSSDNALIYYLSGLLHQEGGNADRAEIDYRNALAYAPGSPPLLHALESLDPTAEPEARLVILHESGWVISKIPFSLPVFINGRIYNLSFPYYPDTLSYRFDPGVPLKISTRTEQLHQLINVNSVARKALEEEFPAILFRQALRVIAKDKIQKEANQQDPLLGAAASIFSLLSDFPDLRSWLSLPASISVADLSLPPGDVSLSLPGMTGEALSISLKPGEITLVRLISADGGLIKVDSYPIPIYTAQP